MKESYKTIIRSPLPAVIGGNGYRRPVEIGEDEPERRWQQGYAHLEGIR